MAQLEAAIAGLVSRLESVAQRLESVEGQLAAGGGGAGAGAGAGAVAAGGGDDEAKPFVGAYADLIKEHIDPLVARTADLGDDVLTSAVAAVKAAVDAQLAFLGVVSASKKPTDQAVLQKLLADTSAKIAEVTGFFESNRGHAMSNHLQTLSEGIPALGWVMVEPTPGPFVGDMRGGSEFYSNRILKEFKDKDENQVGWVKAFNGFLRELQVYIKAHHTTGLVWNPKGGDAAAASPAPAPAAAAAGGPPPPPGPAPPPPAPEVVTGGGGGGAAAGGADMSNVFASLNKGSDITKGLKKVTSDMKTKNRKPEERSGAVKASATKPKAAPARRYGAAAAAAKPPKVALSGTKWEVEFLKDSKDTVVNVEEIRHTVYIYRCESSTVQIKGKCNAVIIDSCKRIAVVADDVVANVEIVNSQSVEMQVVGTTPAFSVDKCSSVLLHISEKSIGAQIVTSKCDSVNVSFPKEGSQDPTEQAIPEQFLTVIKGGELVTEQVRHE